jgi:glycosyl transferase family 2
VRHTIETTTFQRQLPADTLAQSLAHAWRRALTGDAGARAQWRTAEGGGWGWRQDGALLQGGGEWSALRWERCDSAALRALRRFAVEVTVDGEAQAAGISFGPYKDFLVALEPGAERRLRLAVDGDAGCWGFWADGELVGRSWWDAALRGIDDLLDGALTLKAHRGTRVRFSRLAIAPCAAACRLSVVMTCNRFLQRLRLVVRNWCQQELPFGAYEVLVVNPASPDGAHEYLEAVARSFPHVPVREVAVEPELALNKGAMINRAARASRGEWVWLTDADCLFGTGAAAAALEHMQGRPPRLFYVERRYLPQAQTEALLAGRLDGLRDFDALARLQHPRGPDCEPWGYTQIVPRRVLEQTPYQEQTNHFAYTDKHFVEACARRGVAAEPIPGLFCLHLDHPFAWYGTETFL